MNIGFIGTGKLGLPVSLVYCSYGNNIKCYDINPVFYEGKDPIDLLYKEEMCPNNKIALYQWLKENSLKSTYEHTKNIDDIVLFSDLIFVSVQTPHKEKYEGTKRLTEERDDFNYSYLRESVQNLSESADRLNKVITVIIISTVLPGTIRREIYPILSKNIRLCYNPYFIAMGTVANDCINPEFILLGNRDKEAEELVTTFYKTICSSPVYSTTIENAELIKVSYNTFIGTKIAMANTIMELCHRLPNTDCDKVMEALYLANKRLISASYLRGGMGDGGGCHPRDNIALSWLSNKLGFEYNWYDSIMKVREKQTDFLANLIEENKNKYGLPVVLLGKSFKANTSISTGSPALLLSSILKEKNIDHNFYDPFTEDNKNLLKEKSIYLVSCNHDYFMTLQLPEGSILIDPHRKYEKCIEIGVYIPVGKNL